MDFNSAEFRDLANIIYIGILFLIHLLAFRSPNLRWLSITLITLRLIDIGLFPLIIELIPRSMGWAMFLFFAATNFATIYVIVFRYYLSQHAGRLLNKMTLRYPSLNRCCSFWLPTEYDLKILPQEMTLVKIYKWAVYLNLVVILQYPISWAYDNPESYLSWLMTMNHIIFDGNEYAIWDFQDTANRLLNIFESIVLFALTFMSLLGIYRDSSSRLHYRTASPIKVPPPGHFNKH